MITIKTDNASIDLQKFIDEINKTKKSELDKYTNQVDMCIKSEIRMVTISKPGREEVSKEFEEKRKNFVKLVESYSL